MTDTYRIVEWERYQHYRDRNPPWIKLHRDLLTSRTWVSLDDASRVLAVVCMLIAADTDNQIPDDPAYIRRRAYLDYDPDLSALVKVGFLEPCKNNAVADASKPLASASAAQADARPETETEQRQSRAETESTGADAPTKAYAFQGKVVRLTPEDLASWQRAYPAVPDIRAELQSADDYYAANPPDDGKWFHRVSNWLKRANEKAQPPPDAEAAAFARMKAKRQKKADDDALFERQKAEERRILEERAASVQH